MSKKSYMQTNEEEDENKIFYQGWGAFYAMDPASKLKVGEKFYSN